MSKHIDEIMRISDKGYADNFEDIKDILENFMSYTVEEIAGVLPYGYNLKSFSDDVIQKLGDISLANGNYEAYKDILQLSDLFCTMKYFDEKYKYIFKYNPLFSYMRSMYCIIRDAKNLPWVKLFQAISVTSLMDFFDRTFTDKNKPHLIFGNKFYYINYSRIYKSICLSAKKYASFEVTDTTTVKQLFSGVRDTFYSCWNPCQSQSDYFEKIERCALILKHIFVDGLGTWYYDRFSIFELTKRINSKIDKFDFDNIEDFEFDFNDINL